MPTISPRRTVRSTGPKRRPLSWLTVRTISPWSSCDSGKTVSIGRPTINVTTSASVTARGFERALADPVAQYRDPSRHLEHLGQPVADVDDAHSVGRQRANQFVQPIDLRVTQCCGGLVEQQHLRVRQQRLDDFEHLSLGERQSFGSCVRRGSSSW